MIPEVINGLFAISGVLLGVIATYFLGIRQAKKSREKTELTLSKSFVSQLVAINQDFGSDIKIIYQGGDGENSDTLNNLIMSEIYVSNTGDRVVENILLNISNSESNSRILSVSIHDQRNDSRLIGGEHSHLGSVIDVKIDFINPQEEASIKVLLTGKEPDWNIQFRQPGVKAIFKDEPRSSFSDVILIGYFNILKDSGIFKVMKFLSPEFKAIVSKFEEKGAVPDRINLD